MAYVLEQPCLYPWQADIMDHIDQFFEKGIPEHKVIWCQDPRGDTGKSTLQKFIVDKYHNTIDLVYNEADTMDYIQSIFNEQKRNLNIAMDIEPYVTVITHEYCQRIAHTFVKEIDGLVIIFSDKYPNPRYNYTVYHQFDRHHRGVYQIYNLIHL